MYPSSDIDADATTFPIPSLLSFVGSSGRCVDADGVVEPVAMPLRLPAAPEVIAEQELPEPHSRSL
jgi:hypothetical protein